jgi:hypothetical protein
MNSERRIPMSGSGCSTLNVSATCFRVFRKPFPILTDTLVEQLSRTMPGKTRRQV